MPAPSAYILFSNDARAKLNKSANPPAAKEMMSLLAAQWKALSAEDRKPWDAAAVKAKASYVPKATEKKAKKEPKVAGEKKAPNAYMRFTTAKRPQVNKENPGIKITEVSKVIGAMWAKLSPAEKEAWKTK
jgi:high mobility group protein B1